MGEGDEVNGCFRSGGGSGFGKGFGVFSFSRLTGAAYLLGVVLMHWFIVGKAARWERRALPLKLTTWNAAGWPSGNAKERH